MRESQKLRLVRSSRLAAKGERLFHNVNSANTRGRSINPVQAAAVFIWLGIHAAAAAETPAASQTDAFVELTTFLRGHWQCSGHFTNGTLISAKESFDPVLSGGWLLQIHDDDPPFQYHAYSLWGVDKQSGDLLVTIHDVTGGLRLFKSSTWTAPSFVLEGVPIPGKLPTSERFTYERNSAGAFSFEYAIRRGFGDWVAVDRSDCKKASPAAAAAPAFACDSCYGSITSVFVRR